MDPITEFLNKRTVVVTAGAETFAESLEQNGVQVARVGWRPSLAAEPGLARYAHLLLSSPRVKEANKKALELVSTRHPMLVDVVTAKEAIPFLRGRAILHAGPPVDWERMCGPMRGATLGAIVLEGWAPSLEEAEKLVASGSIRFAPCHEHSAVGPMSGIISPSMPILVVEDASSGYRTYTNFNEGRGKVLRHGANGPDVLEKMVWIRDVLAPAFKEAIRAAGPIDARAIITEALEMGDECHNRVRAATMLLMRTLAPKMALSSASPKEISNIFDYFLKVSQNFFINIGMAAGKCMMDAAAGVENSTLVYTMARNGTDFGIRVAGLGDEWFTAPSELPEGLYAPGFGPDDRNPDMGDSAIAETAGFGGLAMVASPSVVLFVGGSVDDALRQTMDMYQVTLGEHPHFRIPSLGFRGTPFGIDVAKVVRTGLRPPINTGMAHRLPGIGMIGAGIAHPPAECFTKALAALRQRLPDAELEKEAFSQTA